MNTVIKPTLSAVWSTDAQGICITSQESPAGLIPTLEGVTLSAWLRLAQADDDAQIALQLTAALECVTPFHIEVPIRCLDGTTRCVIVSGLPDCPPNVPCLQYSGFIFDITGQRKALEEALRTAAEYRLLIENSTDLIAHCDADGRYVSISPSYSKMIGWSADEMKGQPVVDFLHPDDRASATDALVFLFNGGVRSDVVEVRKRHRDGHYITLGTKACGVSDPSTGKNIGAVLVSRDITHDKERIRKLEKLATRDTLTGLPNRAWINDRVSHMLAQGKDLAYTTVLFIDLNGFKAVNDSMGHAVGDVLLQLVSERLRRCMRPGDAVARLGGDEFVVAAKCTNRKAASAIARRIINSLKEPFAINSTEVRIGASVGISLARFGAASANMLFENADKAMYQAKARQDGSYQFFEPAAQPLRH
ncbi:diguanylate cyclase (GGDEF)-like protein/PAS domain S-box-containing protein [Erwinia persicina]|jgi:diguanylate cyclase (GGDEF)-like protein/PAS domain S-box-containing protein|uniref:Diguanylate cyclase n=1 Tax=Erwinia aeris TaxID=3239803 RepID=A0ABV4E3E3_9GAMM|nr:sensor domain-containing diguanylate cyclase [Erwinia persicina]MCP1436979.1 diguanylate cyclase (GGDEF)-like protein/PAS domain S-box-containing protein [Erwinia persicina]